MSAQHQKVVAATGNPHKLAEMQSILGRFGMKLITKEEAGVGNLEVEENGATFEENSEIKARAITEATGLLSIADDSGLSVDALDGAPGVYSARFAGEHASDAENNDKLLQLMKSIPNAERGAKFVSVVTLCHPDGTVLSARGECHGRIGRIPVGNGGFGYDPLFIPVNCDHTYAQLTAEEKNQISHRAVALRRLEQMLREAGFTGGRRESGAPGWRTGE